MMQWPNKQYACILADPPWKYRVYDDAPAAYGAARSSYQTMDLEAIKALPVKVLAQESCILFLWVTMPLLPEGLEVMKAWGFSYKTVAFTWIKTNRTTGRLHLGLGHYTRGNAELCLLGVRGRVIRQDANVSQIITASRREHSRKPDEQYQRIMQLVQGPYLELFARHPWPGWDVWGNQVEAGTEVPLPLAS